MGSKKRQKSAQQRTIFSEIQEMREV